MMNNFFNYKKHTKIRLWTDELPNSIIEESLFLSKSISVQCDKSWVNKKIAIELSLPKHCSNYGLLGLEFTPIPQQDTLKIKVPYSDKNEKLYHEALAYNDGTVYSSLPVEYAEIIIEKTRELILSCSKFPSGELVFKVGAHCIIGSSIGLFEIITEILLKILIQNKHSHSFEELKEILDKLLVFN